MVRKRWYDDDFFKDNSSVPTNAPTWAISSSVSSGSTNGGRTREEEQREEDIVGEDEEDTEGPARKNVETIKPVEEDNAATEEGGEDLFRILNN